MKTFRESVLLGVNVNRELVFADVGVTTRNNYPEFTASFDVVEPVVASKEFLEERAESMVDGMDSDTKIHICESNDCPPSEIKDIILTYDGIEGVLDISLFPESFLIEGVEDDIYFESVGCGQGDHRHEFNEGGSKLFVSEELFHLIHDTWDNYHLSEIDEETATTLYERVLSEKQDKDENEFIEVDLKEMFV